MAPLNNVLDLARMEADTCTVTPRPCNVRDVLLAVEGSLRPEAYARGISLQIKCEDTLPETIGTDSEGLRRCLLNLIGTAIKLTHEGLVRVVVSAEPDRDPRHLRLDVENTGIGISQEKQKLIFEAFVQVDGESTLRHDGAGLGLTVARRMAHLLGGGLTVSSGLGQGPTFTLRVPVAPATVRQETVRKGNEATVARKVERPLMQMTEESPIDLASPPLGSYSDRTLRGLAATFLTESQSLMACLRNAARRQDSAAVKSWAQQFGGLAQSVAAQGLAHAARQCGQAVCAEDPVAVTVGIENIEKEMNKVITLFSDADWILRLRSVRHGNCYRAHSASE